MSKTFAKILIFPVLFMLLIGGGCMMFASQFPAAPAYAATVYAEQVEDLGFNSTNTSLQSPDTNKWSVITPSGVDKNNNIVSGIISINADVSTFENSYKLDYTQNINQPSEKPNEYRNKMLMINNPTESNFSQGYESKALDLAENSFYIVTVWYKTLKDPQTLDNSYGSVYVINADTNEEIKTNLAKTNLTNTPDNINGGWNKLQFFVSTNELRAYSIKLQLWLGQPGENGSTGAIFYDSISVLKVSERRYNSETTAINSEELKLIMQDLRSHTRTNFPLSAVTDVGDVANFEEKASERKGIVANIGKWPLGTAVLNGSQHGGYDAPLNHTADMNNIGEGLLAASKTGGYAKFVSPQFTIQRHGVYLISFWAKSEGSPSINATVRTQEFIGGADDEDECSTTRVITTKESVTTQSWERQLMIIEGNVFYDTKCILELEFGSAGETTTGYVAFADLAIDKLSHDDYQAAKNLDNISIGSLNQFNSDAGTFANGYFNFGENVGFETEENFAASYTNVAYPLNNVAKFTPNASANINKENSGIVALPNLSEIGASNYGDYENNVLKIDNRGVSGWQYYETDPKTISAGEYKKISVVANSQAGEGDAYIALMSGKETLCLVTVPKSSNSWQPIEIAVGGSFYSFEISVRLMVGVNTADGYNGNADGCAFFDNLEIDTIDKTAFDAVQNKVNLDYEEFRYLEEYFDLSNSVYKSATFEVTEDEADLYVTTGMGSKNVLVFESSNYVYSKATGTRSYVLSAQNYYKISFSVMIVEDTFKVDPEFEPEWFEEDECYDEDYGITVGLVNFDENFSGIKETKIKNHPADEGYCDFITYEFYVHTSDERPTSPQIIIGSTKAKIAATVLVNDFKIEKIDSSIYKAAEIDTGNTAINIVMVESTDTIPEDEGDNDHDDHNHGFEWNWFYFSTIVLALTLLVVIGTIITKKTKFKKLIARRATKKKKESPLKTTGYMR